MGIINSETGAVTYEGLVLGRGEHNYYDDSDFYALVWDEESQSVKEVLYGTTRCGWMDRVVVDATPGVRAKAEAYYRREEAQRRLRADIAQANTPAIGREVVVVKGRKIRLGTTGVVVRTYEWVNPYVPRRHAEPKLRLLLRLECGREEWIDAANVAVVNPDQYREYQDVDDVLADMLEEAMVRHGATVL